MYSASSVASYVICWCNDANVSITNLKLQKLLYLLQGYYSAIYENRLMEEDFYAWQLGPVVPSVYKEYSIYAAKELSNDNCDVCLKPEEKIICDEVLNEFANKSAGFLVDLTHNQDPWKYTVQLFGEGSLIPYELIFKFFKEEVEHG